METKQKSIVASCVLCVALSMHAGPGFSKCRSADVVTSQRRIQKVKWPRSKQSVSLALQQTRPQAIDTPCEQAHVLPVIRWVQPRVEIDFEIPEREPGCEGMEWSLSIVPSLEYSRRKAKLTGADEALCMAFKTGDEVAIKVALAAGANPNMPWDAMGYHRTNPLTSAIRNAACRVVCLLLQHGADIDLHGALCIAANAGHEVCVRLLLAYGADPAWCGANSLCAALSAGRVAIVRRLLAHDPLLPAKSNEMEGTIWHMVSRCSRCYNANVEGQVACQRLLLENGSVPVDALNGRGNTALFDLIDSVRFLTNRQSHIPLVRQFLEFGADPNILCLPPDDRGYFAHLDFDLCMYGNHFLGNRMPLAQIPALFLAMKRCDFEGLQELLTWPQTDLLVRDSRGRTAHDYLADLEKDYGRGARDKFRQLYEKTACCRTLQNACEFYRPGDRGELTQFSAGVRRKVLAFLVGHACATRVYRNMDAIWGR